jgi:hypothetical protein
MDEFLDFESFKRIFRRDGQSLIFAMIRAGDSVELCNKEYLIDLINKLTGKWPHTHNKKCLILGVKRLIQSRFYKEIYGEDKPKTVDDKDAHVMEMLKLCDNKVELKEEIVVEDKPEEPKPKKEKKVREKVVKHKNEFSQKVSNMSKEDLLTWANEVGVDQMKIEKHLNKPLGLFKMNIGNLIRNKLSKS